MILPPPLPLGGRVKNFSENFVKIFLIFRQQAVSICVRVRDQPIFQQHRATSRDILRRRWTNSDATNRLPHFEVRSASVLQKLTILEHRPRTVSELLRVLFDYY